MLVSLRARTGLLILSFFLLLSASVAATLWAAEAQRQDALVVNLAGRQRMLVQQMACDALQAGRDGDLDSRLSMQAAARAFDETLHALVGGGLVTYPPDRTVILSATRDPDILAALAQVREMWTTFSGHLDRIAAAPGSAGQAAAVQAIEEMAPGLVARADEAARRYETAAAHKLNRLRWVQATFLAGALSLLVVDLFLLHKLVVHPLQRLASAARRIGEGDLETPVELAGPREVECLAHSLDQMRAQLLAWTGELETRVAQRTRELAALQEVSREITSQLEIRHLLQSVTDKARALLAADVAVLCLLEEPGHILYSRAVSGPPEALSGDHTSAWRGPAERVLVGKRALPCGAGECEECCGILAAPFRQSHLVAPLRIGARVIGSLCVGGTAAGQFPGEAVHLLTELANSAAIALENARLYEQAERVAALEERQRIAADMHDGLAQTLSVVALCAGQITHLLDAGQAELAGAQLRRLQATAERAWQEVRQVIASLQQDPQPPQALQEQLGRLVADLGRGGEPGVDLILALQQPLLLSPDDSEQVLRVVGEALHNARRHGQARHIVVRLEQRDSEAILVVTDDGVGFDPARSPADGRQHFGLSIMRARAARLGGSLVVQSAPGQGTQVVLTWPVNGGS